MYSNRSNNNRRENRGFYSKSHRQGNFKKNFKGRVYRTDDQGDVEMGGHPSTSTQRFLHGVSGNRDFKKNSGKRRNKPGRNGGIEYNKNKPQYTWVKVTIPFGKKMEKNQLLKDLANLASDKPFVPVNYHHDGNSAVFFVNDTNSGFALKKYSKQLASPEGFLLKIMVTATSAPIIHMNKDVVEKVKVAMSKRFDAATNCLNLSKFQFDACLKEQCIYAPLYRHQVMNSVVEIILENIPQIKSLDLSFNKLNSLSALSPLFKKSEFLTEVNFKGNSLKSVAELDKIQSSKLTSIILDQNPVCNAFKDKTEYISSVRRRFPKVVKLDGIDLPPAISFEIEKEIKLPSSQGSFFTDEKCKPLILSFLDQYYTVFDSKDRQSLLEAYNDNSSMSMSVGRPKSGQIPYQKLNRNLLSIKDNENRNRLLRRGKLQIVACLNDFPRTMHDRKSFTIDVSLVSTHMMSFTVCGLFKEFENEVDTPHRSPIRYFSRTFIVVPQGSGICIINDTLFITQPSSEQIKQAFKDPAPTPSPSPVPDTSTMPVNSANSQQQMISEFSVKSGMNAEFSAKCLAENNWNFDKAALTFVELNKRGVIPREAFIK